MCVGAWNRTDGQLKASTRLLVRWFSVQKKTLGKKAFFSISPFLSISDVYSVQSLLLVALLKRCCIKAEFYLEQWKNTSHHIFSEVSCWLLDSSLSINVFMELPMTSYSDYKRYLPHTVFFTTLSCRQLNVAASTVIDRNVRFHAKVRFNKSI